jgi:autotransporter-associated beta strand protein
MKNKTCTHASSLTVFAPRSFPLETSASGLARWLVASAAALLFCCPPSTPAQTWNLGAGGSWATAANWTPATVPNAIGAAVVFESATAARTVTTDSGTAGFTVGSISNDIAGSFANSFTTGTAGSKLILNNGGAGVKITTTGSGTGNNTFSVPLVFSDSVTGIVIQTSQSSAAGSLNITATVTGTGGFTKEGLGLATFGTGTKTYSGPTVLNGGRMRISNAAHPTATSGLTINTGGQLELITAGTYTFGSNPVNLNGAGPTSGPYAQFPGAIRPTTGLVQGIANAIVLQSDSLIHVQGAGTATLTLSGTVSGPGKLNLGSIPHDANLGTLVISGANTYSGGTVVDGGTLDVSGASATLGTGDVTVHSANLVFANAVAVLKIESGVANAIANSATLSLAGGNAAGVADDGYADLGTGVNEVVGNLVLGGVPQAPGTYGSTASTATFQNDEYFAGAGIVTVRPVLTITRAEPNIVVSWSTNLPGLQLQSVGALGTTWADDNTMVVVSGINNTVTEPIASTNKFFRLRN